MRELPFELVNVFAIPGVPWTGNALAVFTACAGLDEETMRAIARQMNLAEVTFVEPASEPQVSANVRIFTTSVEMPFAGHPTLGTAHVVHAMQGGLGTDVALKMKAGLVMASRVGQSESQSDGQSEWQLRTAKTASGSPLQTGKHGIARVLGLTLAEVQDEPMWINTGTEQLIVPLRDVEAVRRVRIDPIAMGELAYSEVAGEAVVYVIGPREEGALEARFFTLTGGSVLEDPATGSACANYGGYLALRGLRAPVDAVVHQGSHVGRPSRLGLRVVSANEILVRGAVCEVGRGILRYEESRRR